MSRDFIEGKRARYSNPFQFYISVSIVFFLILGAANKYQELQDFGNKNSTGGFNLIQFENGAKDLDSIIKNSNKDSIINIIESDENLKKLDSAQQEKVKRAIEKVKDSANTFNFSSFNSGKGEPGKFERMKSFQKDHSNFGINQSLDSLNIEKTFLNRFQYTIAGKVNAFFTNTQEENKKLSKEIVSYASIAIFIFLPIFTLFLRFIYIRRKFTYVEHLIFVFHTQTVFFLLSTLFFILWLITHNTSIVPIFLGSFLIYLIIAMKRFYQQGYVKTFIKYLIINFIFVIMGSIGFSMVSLIAFAIY